MCQNNKHIKNNLLKIVKIDFFSKRTRLMYIETNNMKNLFIEAIGVQELKTIIAEAVRVELGKIDFSQKGKLEILNRVEVSKLLNVSMVTLSTWTKTGKIKAYRIGNRVYYKKLNIEEAMKEIKGSLNR